MNIKLQNQEPYGVFKLNLDKLFLHIYFNKLPLSMILFYFYYNYYQNKNIKWTKLIICNTYKLYLNYLTYITHSY